MQNKTKKVVLKSMRQNIEGRLTELKNCSNGMFSLVKGLKIDGKVAEVERRSDGNFCFSVRKRDRVFKAYMERIIFEENDWDHNVEGDAVEGLEDCVSRDEIIQALNEMKP